MSGERLGPVAAAIVARQLRAINPAHIVPPVVIPLLFFAAFAGGLSSVSETPEFDYPDYTAFIFVFVLFMGTSLAAVFRGFAMLSDLESGFARRIMLATPRRMALVLGFLAMSLAQAALVVGIVFAVALVAGMDIAGSALQVAAVFALALLLNVAVSLFSAGVGLRLQSIQTGTLFTLMPVFAFVFVAPVFLPRDQLSGWLEPASAANPLTALLEAGRGLLIGRPEKVGLAFAICAGLIAVFFVWALTGMRQVGERAG